MKCFLSHSSFDKKSYVEIVAKKLRSKAVYDAYTFESGMKTLEEILRGIDISDLFVLFISDTALNSEWVKKELIEAEHQLASGLLSKFFPILIDKTITYEDPRIPKWVRDNYNLKLMSRPVVAARQITSRMIELSWTKNKTLKARDSLFVGRNDELKNFEERMDDIIKPKPACVLCEGMSDVGRKTFLIHALRKANLVRPSYSPISIDLQKEDGLDGFIQKVFDLGLSQNVDITNLLERGKDEKLQIAISLVNEIKSAKEILLINDIGNIVKYDTVIAEWFLKLVEALEPDEIVVLVATRYRPDKRRLFKNTKFFFTKVDELTVAERRGLLKRYSEIKKLNIDGKHLIDFASMLTGLPGQAIFTVEAIEELGIQKVYSDNSMITNYSKERANTYVRKYENEPDKISVLRFIATFEFISLNFLAEISKEVEIDCEVIVQEFINDTICVRFGSSGEYVKLNDVIRDHITRNRLNMDNKFLSALKRHADQYVTDFDEDFSDASEYYISMQRALLDGRSVPENMLVPSHFLKAMKKLYSDGSFDDVIRLARTILGKRENYDQYTEHDVRYYLCQSLARKRDSKFLEEVQHIDTGEHDFLLGFYYRLIGKFEDAIKRFRKSMTYGPAEQRSRRELVHMLSVIEDYDGALSLARENYEKFPDNAFIVQSYFNTVLNSKSPEKTEISNQLLDKMVRIVGPKSAEMHGGMLAIYEAQINNDRAAAIKLIDDVLASYPNSRFAKDTKLKIQLQYLDFIGIEETLKSIDGNSGESKYLLKKAKAGLAASRGDHDKAKRIVESEMRGFSADAKERLLIWLSKIRS